MAVVIALSMNVRSTLYGCFFFAQPVVETGTFLPIFLSSFALSETRPLYGVGADALGELGHVDVQLLTVLAGRLRQRASR